jgi:glycosyltransferase involved in cell wall biosynthesis
MAAMSPELSVAVVVGRLRDRAAPCLRSILAQGVGDRLEVLLVDCGGDGQPAVAGSDDPRVRHFTLPPRTTFALARSLAVREARGEVIAFVEEHVRLRPGWARALLRAFAEGPWAGVGAVPRPVGTEPAGQALAAISYGEWWPPVPRGEVALLPGHNASFRTSVLRGYPDLERLLCCDLVLHGRLRADGHRLAMEPDAEFVHLDEDHFWTLARGVFYWYRCYGPLRADEEGWSRLRRLLYVLATPFVPLYFLRSFRRRLRRHEDGRRLFYTYLPGALGVLLAGAAGRALGLLFGPGDAPVRFSDYELHAPRTEHASS